MKKLSKILVLLLSVAIVCAGLIMVASADGTANLVSYVDESGETQTADLATAIANTSDGYVTLEGDLTLSTPFSLSEGTQVMINLNGYKLTSTGNAFTIAGSGIYLGFEGTGSMQLGGALATADASCNEFAVEVIGDEDTAGIDIYHTASNIISTYHGSFLFQNVDIVSTSDLAVGGAYFDTAVDTASSAQFMFDNVEFDNTSVAYKAGTGNFIVRICGTAGVTMNNSGFYTKNSAINAGHLKDKGTATGDIIIDNTTICCLSDTMGGGRSYILHGQYYNFDQNSEYNGFNGTITVTNSDLTCNTRMFTMGNNDKYTLNISDSRLKLAGQRGTDTAYSFTRGSVTKNFTGINYISFAGSSFATAPVGTRSNRKAALSIDTNVHEIVYDPVGDRDYPYVVVEKGTVKQADYHKNYSFDMLALNNSTAGTDLYVDGATAKYSLAGGETFWNVPKGMQWDIKVGTLTYVRNPGNSYVKYWINGTGDTRVLGNDPYFIMGLDSQGQYSENSSTYVSAFSGANRKAVMVSEVDIMADPIYGFPEFSTQVQARVDKNASGTNKPAALSSGITVNNDGSISNTLTDGRSEAPWNPAGQWNRVSCVVYSDPANSQATAYHYINGVYMGKCNVIYLSAVDAKSTVVYFQGLRLNISKTEEHVVNSGLYIDNVSFRCYTDYQFEGEHDSTFTTDADGKVTYNNDGVYKPENYIIATPGSQNLYATPYSVGGNRYETIAEAKAAAETLKTDIKLVADVYSDTIKENVTIDKNGYSITVSDDSYGFITEGDKVIFNEDYWYNAYWFNGEVANIGSNETDDDFVKTVVKLGHDLDNEFYYSGTPDYVNENVNTQVGWALSYNGTVVVPGVPTMTEYDLAGENKILRYYPVMDTIAMAYYVKNAEGPYTYGFTDEETTAAYHGLKNGETLVLCKDFTPTESNAFFSSTDDAELVVGLDLNGYKLIYRHGGAVAWVGNNSTINVYSSRPGGHISSYYLNPLRDKNNVLTGEYDTNSQRMFGISGAPNSEGYHYIDAVKNAHINVGTFGDIPGSNMSINGGVTLEGVSGGDTCSITMDGVFVEVGTPTSGGSIMTRYYDGEIIVTNCTFVLVEAAHLIDMKAYGVVTTSGVTYNQALTPYVLLDGCFIMARGSSNDYALIGGCGDGDYVNENGETVPLNGAYETQLEIKNTVITCRLNGTGTPERIKASNVTVLKSGDAITADGEKFVSYNVPITFESLGIAPELVANGYYAFTQPYVNENKELAERTVYVVENGKTANAPEGAIVFELQAKYAHKFTSDYATVTYVNPKGETITTEYYAKGGNIVSRPTIPECKTNALTLTHNGGFDTDFITNIQADATIIPTYTAKANVEGIKANLSLYADFNINLFIPASYENYVTLDGATKVMVGDVEYLKATIAQKCNKAADSVVFNLAIAENVGGIDYTADATVTISIVSYASAVLDGEYTDSDKVLMTYMLSYANAAAVYFGGEADSTISTILENCADYMGKYTVEKNYDEAISETNLGTAFKNATIDLASTPAFVLTLEDGFAGTITVSYAKGVNVRTYTVTAEDSRTIVIEGMKVYNFGTILDITAVGTIGEEEVDVSGRYSLDTFAKYHTENAADAESETQETSVKCLPLIEALCAYAEVAELYKTGELASKLA